MTELGQQLIRSCAQEGVAPRAVPYAPASYAAFQVGENGRTYPIEGLVAGSLAEALTQAIMLRAFSHKQHLVVREDAERGGKLHIFAIKRKSAARYVHKDHVTRAVHDLYAAPVCTIDMDAITDEAA